MFEHIRSKLTARARRPPLPRLWRACSSARRPAFARFASFGGFASAEAREREGGSFSEGGRFARAQDGTAAVEFALVATPFLALIFAILETALVFFAGQTLESAATDTARLIMTGQAQTAGYSQTDFKTAVCNRLAGGLFDCSNGVYVDVKTYSSFTSINTTPPITNGKLDTSNMTYAPGVPGSIVVVRLYYQWPIYVSMLGDNLANLSGGNRLLVATSVFRNEPYGS